MNFTENQRTGVLAENVVESLFLSWFWTVGRDRIDVGYDLFVEPDRERFKGQRFLVQVKGTARQKRGAPTAKVSKSNLRKYAANRIPVFLVRANADGTFHWLHIQRWASLNCKRLDGNGETSIALPVAQTFDEKDGFLAYLDDVLKPPAERPGGVAEVAQERSRYLSSLDSRLSVRVGIDGGNEKYEIFARSEPTMFGLQMTPSSEPENIAKLKDAVQYGLPATIQVDAFRMTGSELFEAIGANSFHQGKVSIGSSSPREGTVNLYPGNHYSMLAPEVILPAHLYSGHGGFAISNERREGLFDFKLRGETSTPERGSAQVTIGLREDPLAAAPIRDHATLANLGEWAYEVMKQDSIFMELAFSGNRVPLRIRQDSTSSMRDVLYYVFVLGRLHKISKTLNSDLVVGKDFSLTEEDISDIHLLYAILRGEKRKVSVSPIEISSSVPLSISGEGAFYIETALSLNLSGQSLGTIPVAIDLNDFSLKTTEDSLKYRLEKKPGASAFLYYNEQGRTDATMSRTKLQLTPPTST